KVGRGLSLDPDAISDREAVASTQRDADALAGLDDATEPAGRVVRQHLFDRPVEHNAYEDATRGFGHLGREPKPGGLVCKISVLGRGWVVSLFAAFAVATGVDKAHRWDLSSGFARALASEALDEKNLGAAPAFLIGSMSVLSLHSI